jgi:hypothetical protein
MCDKNFGKCQQEIVVEGMKKVTGRIKTDLV